MLFSDMSIEIIVALTIGFVSLLSGLVRAHQTVMEARGRVGKLMQARVGQVERLRRAARTCLVLKRNIREAIKRKASTEVEVEDAQARLQVAEAVDHRLYVLDDRRTKADLSWLVVVSHANYAQNIHHNALPDAVTTWLKGRRFLVFALDADKARGKALSRYPERLGYHLVSAASWTPAKMRTIT